MNRRWAGLWLALAALFFVTGAVHADSNAAANSNHVIIISLDGMRPEFYLPGELSSTCETLTSLRDAGSYAKGGAFPPYPSMTYCGHASIITGVLPARHGVTANSMFEPPSTEGRGFWFADDIQTPALWDMAHKAGLTVGTVSWPSTAKSKSIDWNVPEFWTTTFGNELELMRRYASAGLFDDIERSAGPLTADRLKDGQAHDAFLAASAIEIIRQHKPNLMLVHLIETDKEQHRGGRSSPELPAVLRRVDGHLYNIIEATKKAGIYEQTTFIILGDHGFANVTTGIAPNVLLAEKGFITLEGKRVTDWKAMVQNTGGSAGVYLRDPKDLSTATKVRALLGANALDASGKRLYQIIDKDRLVKLGGPRDAAFYLESELGNMFSGSMNGEFIRPAPLKGNHGYLFDKPGLQTGFIASGRGIKKGVVLDTIRLVDVAPTAAELLGLHMENTDGQTLKEILQ
jgi:predicted AlkP superfamily pyrophosphatase or phosphodiesterase